MPRTPEQILQQQIGVLVFQNAALLAEVEALKAKLAEATAVADKT